MVYEQQQQQLSISSGLYIKLSVIVLNWGCSRVAAEQKNEIKKNKNSM